MNKACAKDIQLTGIKHAKQAIADLLNEQSEMARDNERLSADNVRLREALQTMVTEVAAIVADGTLPKSALEHQSMKQAQAALSGAK